MEGRAWGRDSEKLVGLCRECPVYQPNFFILCSHGDTETYIIQQLLMYHRSQK